MNAPGSRDLFFFNFGTHSITFERKQLEARHFVLSLLARPWRVVGYYTTDNALDKFIPTVISKESDESSNICWRTIITLNLLPG